MTNKKDAYYFPHFCNARHDRKIKRIRKELGPEGYGIFFMLLEILREQTDLRYPLEDVDLLADEIGSSEQKVKVVICNYKLFEIDEEQKFFSPKLIFYLQPYFEKSERARLAANKRWSDANAYANALPEHCDSNASKVKESKVKKSKEEESKDSDSPFIILNEKKLTEEKVAAWYSEKFRMLKDSFMRQLPVDYNQMIADFVNFRLGDYFEDDNHLKNAIRSNWKVFHEKQKVQKQNKDISEYTVISTYN